jgi:hypothetical protein
MFKPPSSSGFFEFKRLEPFVINDRILQAFERLADQLQLCLLADAGHLRPTMLFLAAKPLCRRDVFSSLRFCNKTGLLHECHSERSEESLVISGTDLISTARDVALLNMTARFPTIGLSFLLLTAFLHRFYFCQIVLRIPVVRVDPQCRFEFFYRLGNLTR